MVQRVIACALVAALGLSVFAGTAVADDELRAQVAEMVKEEMGKKSGLRAYWSSGLRLDTADKKVKLKLGGRIMIDANWFDDEDFNDLGIPGSLQEDGVEFRRVRLYNSGLINNNVEYKLQVDFSGGDVTFRDVYIGVTHLEDCLGCLMPNIRVGHQLQPLGLEPNTSSKYITFMERSAIANAFGHAGRRTGIKIHDSLRGDQLTYALSYFSPNSDAGDGGDFDFDDGMAVAARVTWVPWYDCNCECKRFHIGASYASYSDMKGRRFRARPPAHLASRYVDTGTISDIEDYTTLGIEAALVYGPLRIQAEYMTTEVDSASAGDPTFSGWYVFASYFLTGECANYKKGTFSRVKPCCNFLDNDCCCTGAWELAVRYEGIDLSDGAFDGGEMTALTVGVNWYLNPNTRVMFNYWTATIDGTPAGFDSNPDFAGTQTVTFNDDDISGFGVRFQVDF